MPTTVHSTVVWKRHVAGEFAWCMKCGGKPFTKVLPRSITWTCLEQAHLEPAPGGNRYQCSRCKAAHWAFTMPEDQADLPPRLVAA